VNELLVKVLFLMGAGLSICVFLISHLWLQYHKPGPTLRVVVWCLLAAIILSFVAGTVTLLCTMS